MTPGNREPVFSIVMATYNRSHLLLNAVNSVLRQTYQNFELIIIDDASSDNTEEICRSFHDERIVYRRQAQNRGALAARNIGFDLAKGQYIAWLDDDDELVPTALEVSLIKFRQVSQQGIRILWFDSMDLEQKRRSGYGPQKAGKVQHNDILCGRIGGDFLQVFERDLIGDNVRFDERLWGGEIILWLALHRESDAYYFPEVLCLKRRQHGGERMCQHESLLKHLPRVILTYKSFLNQYGEEMRRLCPKAYGRQMGVLGRLQILNNEKVEGRKTLRTSLNCCLRFECVAFLFLSYLMSSRRLKSLLLLYDELLNMKPRLKNTQWR